MNKKFKLQLKKVLISEAKRTSPLIRSRKARALSKALRSFRG